MVTGSEKQVNPQARIKTTQREQLFSRYTPRQRVVRVDTSTKKVTATTQTMDERSTQSTPIHKKEMPST